MVKKLIENQSKENQRILNHWNEKEERKLQKRLERSRKRYKKEMLEKISKD